MTDDDDNDRVVGGIGFEKGRWRLNLIKIDIDPMEERGGISEKSLFSLQSPVFAIPAESKAATAIHPGRPNSSGSSSISLQQLVSPPQLLSHALRRHPHHSPILLCHRHRPPQWNLKC